MPTQRPALLKSAPRVDAPSTAASAAATAFDGVEPSTATLSHNTASSSRKPGRGPASPSIPTQCTPGRTPRPIVAQGLVVLADGVACHALRRHVDAIVVVVRLADGREGKRRSTTFVASKPSRSRPLKCRRCQTRCLRGSSPRVRRRSRCRGCAQREQSAACTPRLRAACGRQPEPAL